MDVNIFCESLNISATTERCKKRFSTFLCSVVLLTNLIVVDVEFKRVARRCANSTLMTMDVQFKPFVWIYVTLLVSSLIDKSFVIFVQGDAADTIMTSQGSQK